MYDVEGTNFVAMDQDEYLEHFGVKGMRWGHRKAKDDTSNKKHGLSNRHKKIIAVVGSVAALSVGAYLVNLYMQKYGTVTIKAGKTFQHLAPESGRFDAYEKGEAFYASYLKKDNKKYANGSVMGKAWSRKMNLYSNKNIKVAGRGKAQKLFSDFVKQETGQETSRSTRSRSYFRFNKNLNSPDMHQKELNKKFYKYMQDRGYDAVRDMNDQFQSGTTSPIIIFSNIGGIKIKDLGTL